FHHPHPRLTSLLVFFFFQAPALTEIYTLSLHDALPILESRAFETFGLPHCAAIAATVAASIFMVRLNRSPDIRPEKKHLASVILDRKSTRLNSSHSQISYAVFCLKKKKKIPYTINYAQH